MILYAKLIAAALAGAVLAYLPFVNYGKSLGRSELIQELQEDRATILKNGKQVDEKAYSADDASLCAILGGCSVPDETKPH